MKIYITFKGDYAVSEVVGGLILVLIAVAVFSVIFLYVMSSTSPEYESSVKIEGAVSDQGDVLLEHVGGNSIENYKMIVRDSNGKLLVPPLIFEPFLATVIEFVSAVPA